MASERPIRRKPFSLANNLRIIQDQDQQMLPHVVREW